MPDRVERTRILVGTTGELNDGDAKLVPLATPIVLFKSAGRIFATDQFCTHEDAPLADAWVHDDCSIECPWHGARFDLSTGAALSAPAIRPLRTHPVMIEGDEIYVMLEE
jgi:3-phenylpropionate/trans-cinnamate dioxygenase ferredoxin component